MNYIQAENYKENYPKVYRKKLNEIKINEPILAHTMKNIPI